MSVDTLTRPDLAPPRTRRQRRDRFRGDIEGLRAVAVVLVVAFHAGVGVVGGGFVGVDVFFVLSGFLITGLLVDEIARTGSISIGDFYARRVRRLLPLSTLVLAATAVATFVLVPPIDREGVAGDIVGAAVWGANWKFAAESTQYMADTDKSPVLHYWSLAVEEQFYVVWPLLLLLLVGGSGLALRAWPVAFRRISLALGRRHRRVAGALVGADRRRRALRVLRAAHACVGARDRRGARPAAPDAPADDPRCRPGGRAPRRHDGGRCRPSPWTRAPPSPARPPSFRSSAPPCSSPRGPASPTGSCRSTLSRPVPRYVGRISYAWYLWHWPVLVLATARWGEVTTGDDGAAASSHAPATVVRRGGGPVLRAGRGQPPRGRAAPAPGAFPHGVEAAVARGRWGPRRDVPRGECRPGAVHDGDR